MADHAYITMTAGGRRIGLPREAVRALLSWCAPRPLPRCAPWMLGLVVTGGQAVPVVREEVLGPAHTPPEVLVVLGLGGRLVAVPGSSPALAYGGAGGTEGGAGAPFWAGEVEDAGGRAAVVDVARLYTALGLHYN